MYLSSSCKVATATSTVQILPKILYISLLISYWLWYSENYWLAHISPHIRPSQQLWNKLKKKGQKRLSGLEKGIFRTQKGTLGNIGTPEIFIIWYWLHLKENYNLLWSTKNLEKKIIVIEKKLWIWKINHKNGQKNYKNDKFELFIRWMHFITIRKQVHTCFYQFDFQSGTQVKNLGSKSSIFSIFFKSNWDSTNSTMI